MVVTETAYPRPREWARGRMAAGTPWPDLDARKPWSGEQRHEASSVGVMSPQPAYISTGIIATSTCRVEPAVIGCIASLVQCRTRQRRQRRSRWGQSRLSVRSIGSCAVS